MEQIKSLTSIVRIVSQNITFDWYNPYKTGYSHESIGTGFFIEDGLILTCAHVIEEHVKIYFTIPSEGKNLVEAEILSICFDKDIALLKTNYRNKSSLQLGDSDKIVYGEKVTAIGYPLGEEGIKYTGGMISGRHETYIQTDTPINAGNSGGPLINEKNEVIGINTSKISSDNAENIGFATPIHDFIIIKEQMILGDPLIIRTPDLGCKFGNTDKYLLQVMGLANNCKNGIIIKKIYNTSALYNAGIRKGDIICSFDDKEVDNYGECNVDWSEEKVSIIDIMDRININDSVKIEYLDSHNNFELNKVTVTFNVEKPYKIRFLYPPIEQIDHVIFGGLVIMPLALNHLINIEDNNIPRKNATVIISFENRGKRLQDHLIVTNILQGSYISKTDIIQNGDLIISVNGFEVHTLDDLMENIIKFKFIDNEPFIIIKFKSKSIIALNVNKILEEEDKLAKEHGYNKKPIIELLEQNKLQDESSNPKSIQEILNTDNIDNECKNEYEGGYKKYNIEKKYKRKYILVK